MLHFYRMKFLETKFEDYVNSCSKENLHPELQSFFKNTSIQSNNMHLIAYGPSGVGKYSQVLHYIQQFSPSGLKYERKLTIDLSKKQYFFKISDIHFEIDMELLGCNAKNLWNTAYYQILDIVSTRPSRKGIIVCKNFHKIHTELLETFYSYMQTLTHKNMHLTYILITNSLCFIPENILIRCLTIPIKRPTKAQYTKCIGRQLVSTVNVAHIRNIKDLYSKNTKLMNINKITVSKLVQHIENYTTLDFLQLRDHLYNIFIYHLDLNECIWELLIHFIDKGSIDAEKMERVLLFLSSFLKYYNNNYRPIYHLERFVLFLCKEIHGL